MMLWDSCQKHYLGEVKKLLTESPYPLYMEVVEENKTVLSGIPVTAQTNSFIPIAEALKEEK